MTSRQWQVKIPVQPNTANMTFSVLYVRNGDYVFQNLGLKVELPRSDRSQGRQGRVCAGRARDAGFECNAWRQADADSVLTVSVVGQMVYVLLTVHPTSSIFLSPAPQQRAHLGQPEFHRLRYGNGAIEFGLANAQPDAAACDQILERPRRGIKTLRSASGCSLSMPTAAPAILSRS